MSRTSQQILQEDIAVAFSIANLASGSELLRARGSSLREIVALAASQGILLEQPPYDFLIFFWGDCFRSEGGEGSFPALD